MIYPKDRIRLLKDIDICPFVPSEPGYGEWNVYNEARIKQIEDERVRHIEALEADGFFILSFDEARGIMNELRFAALQIDNFPAKRAIMRMLDLYTTDARKLGLSAIQMLDKEKK